MKTNNNPLKTLSNNLLKSFFLFTLYSLLLFSCNNEKDRSPPEKPKESTYWLESFQSKHYSIESPKLKPREHYPWEKRFSSKHTPITKEHFRCKGSNRHPTLVEKDSLNNLVRYPDCSNGLQHSLPLKDNKEHIYPILINLLNFIQEKSGKAVVITCGHRCPDHNTYVDRSVYNSSSKHMIGAEVDFYVRGLEENPEQVIEYLFDYYRNSPENKKEKNSSWTTFERYTKSDTNVSIEPWYNKEIFIKLFNKEEGRDIDNRHPYPYISIQVRWDKERQEKVRYTWNQAYRGYLRCR